MNQNNNFSVLPFYENIDEQLSRRTYAFGEVYPLYVQKGYVLPFQLLLYFLSKSSAVGIRPFSS